MSRPAKILLALFAAAVAVGAGCGGEGALAPVEEPEPEPDAGLPPDAGTGGSGGAAPARKREVLERNPFGNVAASENLLWDGDFEWTSPFSDQYGWLSGPPFSFSQPPVRIGAECRSGIKCVALPKNRALIGLGVGSTTAMIRGSVWARPKSPSCAGIEAYLVTMLSLSNDPTIALASTSDAPDADGFCELSAVSPKRNGKTNLYIENQTGAELLVDDAVLVAVDAKSSASAAVGPPTEAQSSRIDAARLALDRLRGPHDPPPNAAKEAFETWSRRR